MCMHLLLLQLVTVTDIVLGYSHSGEGKPNRLMYCKEQNVFVNVLFSLIRLPWMVAYHCCFPEPPLYYSTLTLLSLQIISGYITEGKKINGNFDNFLTVTYHIHFTYTSLVLKL